MRYILRGALLVLAFVIALKVPDVDQKVGFLVHRSIITHGPALPLLLAFLAVKSGKGLGLTAVFSAGVGVHLIMDLFPKAWVGFALVHSPILGRLSPFPSVVWLVGSAVVCLAATVYLAYVGWSRQQDNRG